MAFIIIGVIFLILQIIAIIGNIISGNGLTVSMPGYEFAYYIGYFLPSIIGIILIIIGVKKRR